MASPCDTPDACNNVAAVARMLWVGYFAVHPPSAAAGRSMHHADAMGDATGGRIDRTRHPPGPAGAREVVHPPVPPLPSSGRAPIGRSLYGLVHPAPRFARVKAHDAAFPVGAELDLQLRRRISPRQPLAVGFKRAADRGTPQGREMLNHVADLVEREGFLVQLFPGTGPGKWKRRRTGLRSITSESTASANAWERTDISLYTVFCRTSSRRAATKPLMSALVIQTQAGRSPALPDTRKNACRRFWHCRPSVRTQ